MVTDSGFAHASDEGDEPRGALATGWDRTGGALWRLVHRRVIQPVLRLNDSPHSLALGVTMGVFVAFTPTVGIQITIVVILGTLLRANRIAAVAMTWISNPVTMIPMYYAYYLLGLFVLRRDGIDREQFNELCRLGDGRSSWQFVADIFHRLGAPLWIGSLIIAVIVTVPVYPWSKKFFARRAARRSSQNGEVPPQADRPSQVGRT